MADSSDVAVAAALTKAKAAISAAIAAQKGDTDEPTDQKVSADLRALNAAVDRAIASQKIDTAREPSESARLARDPGWARSATGMSPVGLARLAFALHEHETSRQFTSDERRKAAREGAALGDGSFPIYNASDLSNAVNAVGRSNHPAATVRAHIRKRAKALGLTDQLPSSFA